MIPGTTPDTRRGHDVVPAIPGCTSDDCASLNGCSGKCVHILYRGQIFSQTGKELGTSSFLARRELINAYMLILKIIISKIVCLKSKFSKIVISKLVISKLVISKIVISKIAISTLSPISTNR